MQISVTTFHHAKAHEPELKIILELKILGAHLNPDAGLRTIGKVTYFCI